MKETIGQQSVYFFIDNKKFLIEPLRADLPILQTNIGDLQNQADYYCNGRLQHKLEQPLASLIGDDDPDNEVFIATSKDDTTSVPCLAMYQLNEHIGSHEFALLLSHDYHHGRLPYELLSALIVEAKNHGVKMLYTTDNTDNVYMRNLADKFSMSVRMDSNSVSTVIYSISVDKHPGIVTIPDPIKHNK